jgi:hypothetical protein
MGLGPTDRVEANDLIARKVPVLFPLFAISGNDDTSMVRTLMPDEQTALAGLVDKSKSAEGSLAIVSDGGCPSVVKDFADQLSKARRAFKAVDLHDDGSTTENFDVAVPLCLKPARAAKLIAALPKSTSVYGLSRELVMAVNRAERVGRHYVLVGENLHLIEAAAERDTTVQTVHADLAAQTLVNALRVSGRRITRAKLLSSIPRTYSSTPAKVMDFTR